MRHDFSSRYCSTCGGAHRMMDVCPEKLGFFELWGAWARAERSAMAWLAFGGLCLFIFLNMVAIQAAST